MPLNPTTLAAEINVLLNAKVREKNPALAVLLDSTDPANKADFDYLFESISEAAAEAVVAHIVANGLVTVSVVSVSGVTVGAGVSGPGAGTGTIS
jgi:hypothetical protein